MSKDQCGPRGADRQQVGSGDAGAARPPLQSEGSPADKNSEALPERVLWKIKAVSEKVMDASLLEADLIALAQSAFNEGVIAERLRTPPSAGLEFWPQARRVGWARLEQRASGAWVIGSASDEQSEHHTVPVYVAGPSTPSSASVAIKDQFIEAVKDWLRCSPNSVSHADLRYSPGVIALLGDDRTAEPQHVCGLQGYNPMIDPVCPGCVARRPVGPTAKDG